MELLFRAGLCEIQEVNEYIEQNKRKYARKGYTG